MDISDTLQSHGTTALELMERMRNRILDEVGLTVSVGISSNRMMAKIASKHAKPKGVLEILRNAEERFLAPLKVGVIPGVGPRTQEKLKSLNVITVADLKKVSRKELSTRFGIHGESLFKKARGEASSNITVSRKTKSIGKERTFSKDVTDMTMLGDTISRMSGRIVERMKKKGYKARGIRLKLRFENFETLTRSRTLALGTDDPDIVREIAEEMLDKNYPQGRKVRLIGVRLTNFEVADTQIELFA